MIWSILNVLILDSYTEIPVYYGEVLVGNNPIPGTVDQDISPTGSISRDNNVTVTIDLPDDAVVGQVLATQFQATNGVQSTYEPPSYLHAVTGTDITNDSYDITLPASQLPAGDYNVITMRFNGPISVSAPDIIEFVGGSVGSLVGLQIGSGGNLDGILVGGARPGETYDVSNLEITVDGTSVNYSTIYNITADANGILGVTLLPQFDLSSDSGPLEISLTATSQSDPDDIITLTV